MPETLWAIVACLSRGDGSLSDLDALRADVVMRTLLGLRNVPEARRAGEWLVRLRPVGVKGLWEAARRFAERVAPLIARQEVETRRYVPVFIDATAIEADGELFEWARKDYRGPAPATGCTRCSWAGCGRSPISPRGGRRAVHPAG